MISGLPISRHERMLAGITFLALVSIVTWNYRMIEHSFQIRNGGAPWADVLHGVHVETETPPATTESAIADNPRLSAHATYPSLGLWRFWNTFAQQLEDARPDVEPPTITSGGDPTRSFDKVGPDTARISLLSMPEEEVEKMRNIHRKMVENIDKQIIEHLPYNRKTQGIVTIGGEGYMTMLVVSLRMLRRTGSTLPVEVFLPTEASYERIICESVLPALNAKCLLLSSLTLTTAITESISSYQYKIFSLLFSSFEQAIFLDSDCFPIHDPRALLSAAPFTTHGLVTWPDYWASSASHLFYDISGIPAPPLNLRASTESGEILVDKTKHARTLLLAAYYNLYGPGLYYKLLTQGAAGEGDKETFLAAATALNASFYQVSQQLITPGYFARGSFHGTAMAQRDPREDLARLEGRADAPEEAQPFFMHQHYPKTNGRTWVEGLDTEGRRAWGSREDTVRRYGRDLEKEMWQDVLWTSCELEDVFKDWKGESGICDKVTKYWVNIVMQEEESDKKGNN